MGVVYEAFDRRRQATVALKVLRDVAPAAILRFKNEFRALADLRHRNLVTLDELFSEGGQWFFTMELVRGVDFLRWVRPDDAPAAGDRTVSSPTLPTVEVPARGGAAALLGAVPDAPAATRPGFDEARLRDGLRQLTEGLLALHGADKIHRDVKPSNVLVEADGRVVVLDFGVIANALTASDEHKIVGTTAYMAPEQAAGVGGVTPAADWYAVGTMLYRCLTGRLPFTGTPPEVLERKQLMRPLPPGQIVLGLPDDLEQLCLDLLARSPADRADGHEVLRRLRASSSPRRRENPTRSAPRAVFVGRRAELAQLRAAFDEVEAGHTIVLALTGESGLGKSTLARHLTRTLADERGALVLAGRCHEREALPYKGIDGVVDDLSRWLESLPEPERATLAPEDASLLALAFPVLGGLGLRGDAAAEPRARSPQRQREQLFGAFRELMLRLGQARPLVVCIDDLQWADEDSLALLRELTRPPVPRMLLVCTIRDDDPRRLLGPGTRVLPLAPLGPDDARALARELAGAPLQHHEELVRESGGNPLFLHELLRHAAAGGPAGSLGGVRLDATLRHRVARLPAGARRVLELLAVAGAPLDREVAAKAAAMTAAQLEDLLRLLIVDHLARNVRRGSQVAADVYHDRVSEAVLGLVSGDAAAQLHRALATALERSGARANEALCRHWLGARDTEVARHYAKLAAQDAARALAFDRAAHFYRLALDCGETDQAMRRELEVGLGDALVCCGRAAEGAEAYLRASDHAASTVALDLRRRAAGELIRSGRLDEARATVRQVLEALGLRWPTTPRAALVGFLGRRALIAVRGLGFTPRPAAEIAAEDLQRIDLCFSLSSGLGIIDTIRGGAFQSQHMLLALRAGEPFRVARALVAEAAYQAAAGWPSRAKVDRLLARARELAASVPETDAVARVRLGEGFAAFMCGQWADGIEHFTDAEAKLQDRFYDLAWEVDTCHLLRATCLCAAGRLTELARLVPRWRADATARGDLYASTNMRVGMMSHVYLVAHDPERAHEEADDAIAPWSQESFMVQHFMALMAHVHADLYAGRGAAALERMERAWPQIERSLLFYVQNARIDAWFLRARALLAAASDGAAADRPRQLAQAARAARRLEREKVEWSTALSMVVRAALANAAGRADEARALLDRSVAALLAVEMPMHAAAARHRLGALTGGDEGRALLAHAEGWLAAEGVKVPGRLVDTWAPWPGR